MKMEARYWEDERTDIEAMCPGLDFAINCNTPLVNVGFSEPIYDEAGLHRSKDPAAGSITPYHNGTTVVTRRIPPGGELFKYYGTRKINLQPRMNGAAGNSSVGCSFGPCPIGLLPCLTFLSIPPT